MIPYRELHFWRRLVGTRSLHGMAGGGAELRWPPRLFSQVFEMRATNGTREDARCSAPTGERRKSDPARKRAGWALEFALMFALTLLLPGPRKRK